MVISVTEYNFSKSVLNSLHFVEIGGSGTKYKKLSYRKETALWGGLVLARQRVVHFKHKIYV